MDYLLALAFPHILTLQIQTVNYVSNYMYGFYSMKYLFYSSVFIGRNTRTRLFALENAGPNGNPTWALPLKERCLCQAVTVPEVRHTNNCFATKVISESLWFTSDPAPLIRRENWTPEKLDDLLERSEYCGRQNI